MTAPYTTRPVDSALLAKLQGLPPGCKLRITQTMRVGMKTWPAITEGTFRHLDSMATGLATERRMEDDIVVAIVHFTKANGELSSIAIDEATQIEVVQ
jgi:hypothetical protein